MKSALTAAGLPGAGTFGTALGTSMPTAPRVITAASRSIWSTINGRTLFGLRRAGNAVNARTAAPTGSVAPPVKAITPLSPIRTPGVARP
jgi:hypothetical protein